MTTQIDPRFYGVWQLDAVRSDHGALPPPRRSLVTMMPASERCIWIHMRTLTSGSQTVQTAWTIDVGGSEQRVGTSDRTMVSTLLDGALETVTYDDGRVVHTALRELIDDDTLKMTGRLVDTDGGQATTTSVLCRCRVKQVLCYRRDLKMRKGKIAAQCAHASMAVFFRRDQGSVDRLVIPLDGPMAFWSRRGFAKIVLAVDAEEDLLEVERQARLRGIPSALITDAGHTEFGGVPTRTTVALGPWVADDIDAITGPEGIVPTRLA